MTILPPTTEAELLNRAHQLAGKTLLELAQSLNVAIPKTLNHAKGWVGQLIEKALGANAFNLDLPDFVELGIELKTLPVSSEGTPCESTYICAATIPNQDQDFAHSRVWRKMAKMLWVPVEANKAVPIGSRRIGTPILWQPSSAVVKVLKQDWEELTELITLGLFEELSANKGTYLQIRPKAANSKTFIQVLNQHKEWISIVPKGFYLRPILTQHILQTHYLFS